MYIAGIAVGFMFVGGFVVSIAGQVLGQVQGIAKSASSGVAKAYVQPRHYSYSAYYRK